MSNCINIKHPDFIKLQKESGLHFMILSAKVKNWQSTNGLDRFPALGELKVFNLFETNPELSGKVYEALGYNQNNNQITPQQKQQAQQIYSEYLNSLNSDNTNPTLKNNQEEQVKKFVELQERLNNKEFIEGAKDAYESFSELQKLGTQEQYNDYIARVSLGITKNPSNKEYNYESKVRDIVYHYTNAKKFDKFDKSLIGSSAKRTGINASDRELGIFFGKKNLKGISNKEKLGTTEIVALINVKNPNTDLYDKAEEYENDIYRFIEDEEPDYEAEVEEVDDENGEVKVVYTFKDKPSRDVLEKNWYDFHKEDLVSKGEDGVVTDDMKVVFEPEQIHILGSKQDVKGFEKFVNDIHEKTFTPEQNKESTVEEGLTEYYDYSGGAPGGDATWDKVGREFGVNNHIHYTTDDYASLSKEERDGIEKQYNEVIKFLGRVFLDSASYGGKLVRRDMMQANSAEGVFGVTRLIAPNEKNPRGYRNGKTYIIPDGGTGYATARGILSGKKVYIFNLSSNYGVAKGWYKWENNNFIKTETPVLTKKFAGIGTREITEDGIKAIEDVYEKTFSKEPITNKERDGIEKQQRDETKDSEQIYEKLGDKTKSSNIEITSWGNLRVIKNAISDSFVVATRIYGTTKHFGNPFSPEPEGKTKGLIKTQSIKEAVKSYIDWIIYGKEALTQYNDQIEKNGLDLDALEERRQWILEQLKSGMLKNKTILYYTELNQPSHATALDYLINKYDWSNNASGGLEMMKDPISKEPITNITSTIFELEPNITEDKIRLIYDNYVNLMNRRREGKSVSYESFKKLLDVYQVYKYKDTYIFGQYDTKTATFITRMNSSPTSKELLAEAIPNIVNKGIDFASFVPKDYADKLVRSGYTSSISSYEYNFKGELMQKYMVVSNSNVFKKIFNKNNNEITAEEIKDFNDSLELKYTPVEINDSLIKKAGNDVSSILETYLSQFGIKVKDINEIKDKLKIDEIGFADLLSKIAYIKDKKDLPPIAGEFIAYMMQYNPLVKNIIDDLIQTNTIPIAKDSYTFDENGNKIYDYNKLDKTEFFKHIGKLIAEDLQNKVEGNYHKSLVDKIKELVKTFFDYLLKTNIDKINVNIGIVSNNILQQNKKLITSSLYKPSAFGKPVKQVNIEDALAKDKFGADIIYKLSKQGFILTGSTALSEQGIILRPNENPLHNIDWVSPFNRKETEDKFLKIYPDAIKVRDINNDKYVTDSYLIAPDGYNIINYKSNNFNGKILIDSYDVVDNKGNIVGTYRLQKQENSNQNEEVVTGIEAKVIDLFSYDNYKEKNKYDPIGYKSKEGTTIYLSNWEDVLAAKMNFSRYKDIWDYNRFIPNDNIENQKVSQNNKKSPKQPQSFVKSFTVNGIQNPIKRIMNNMFPYGNELFQTVKNAINSIAVYPLNTDEREAVNRDFIYFMTTDLPYYTHSIYKGEVVEVNRIDLIKNLPIMIQNIKNKYPELIDQNSDNYNRLLAVLNVKFDKKMNMDILSFNNTLTSTEEQLNEIRKAWASMFNNDAKPMEMESANDVYEKLGSNTSSENIVISSVHQQKGVDYAKSINGVFSMKVDNSNRHFGNPFSHVQSEIDNGLIPVKTNKEAVEKYIDWIINSKDDRAAWIREVLKSGKLKGRKIVYDKELGEPSHATALDYMINKYNWNGSSIRYDLNRIANHLIRYSFWTSGHNFTPNSLNKLINLESYIGIKDDNGFGVVNKVNSLLKYNSVQYDSSLMPDGVTMDEVISHYNNTGKLLIDENKVSDGLPSSIKTIPSNKPIDQISVEIFKEQFVRNNAFNTKLAPRVLEDKSNITSMNDSEITINTKIIPDSNLVSFDEFTKKYSGTYISYKDGNGIRLYKYSGENHGMVTFKRIGLLGSSTMTEYDINSPNLYSAIDKNNYLQGDRRGAGEKGGTEPTSAGSGKKSIENGVGLPTNRISELTDNKCK